MDRAVCCRKYFKERSLRIEYERGVVLSNKYNVGLLKPYLDPVIQPDDDETGVPPDEKPPNLPNRDSHKNTFASSVQSEEGVQTDIDSNKWSKLPDEIVEIILVMAVQSSDEAVSTFNQLSLTCSRFNILIQRKSHCLLPSLQFSEKDYKKLSKYNGKIKVCARKIVNHFGEHCGASLLISEVVNNRKWKSSWLLLEPEKHSMYRIRKFYWIVTDNEAPSKGEEFWIHNELYYLKSEDANILHSENAWFNDRIIDAAQKLICKTHGDEGNYQSVLNTQKKAGIPFDPVYQDHIQLLHDGGSHWFLSFC